MLGDKRGFLGGDSVVLDPPNRDRSVRAAPSQPDAHVPFPPAASFVGAAPPETPGALPLGRDADLHSGDQVGDFVVESKVGEGGMGTVYRARHPLIGKQVAIKVIKPVFAGDPVAVDRFMREARSVNEVGHRNIIDIFLVGQLPTGLPYLVMEYLEGHTLQDEMTRLGRPLTMDEVKRYLEPVFSALEAAHAKGIIHRDVKPENIFIVNDGGREPIIKLLDFGLVKLAREVAGSSGRTSAGMPMGTPDYISPEQSVNYGVDHRADIYSLGIILYRLLAGRLPFTAESSYEMLDQQRFANPPQPSTFAKVSTDVEDVILWALRKRPEERPQSVAELWRALEAAAAQPDAVPAVAPAPSDEPVPIGSAHTPPPESESDVPVLPDAEPVRRRFGMFAAVGGAVAVIGALILTTRFMTKGGEPADPPPTTDQRTQVSATAPPPEASGRLRIAVSPPDAALSIDGLRVAADAELALPAGKHIVRASKAGYLPDEREVVVVAGALAAVPIALQRESVAPGAAAAPPAAPPPKKPASRRSSMRDENDTAKPNWAREVK